MNLSAEDTRLLILALSAAAVASFGWLYDKRLGLQAAQKRYGDATQALADKQDAIIAHMNEELAIRDRLADLRVDELERRLGECERKWDRRVRRDEAAKRRSELIG